MFVDFVRAPRATLGIAGGLMVDGELEAQKTQVMIAGRVGGLSGGYRAAC